MSKKVCLVIGAGAGIGGTVGRKFALEGYHSVLCRRSDEAGLQKMVAAIEEQGGSATGRLLNAIDENAIEDLVRETEESIGPISAVIFNLGAQIGDRSLEHTSLKAFEMGWQLATFALFRVAKAVFPLMAERGGGTLIVTSATASVRGNAGQHSHAAAMGGRRMLCQTLNAQYASSGIHVVHALIDGAVDAPDTLGKMLGAELFAQLRSTKGADDGLILPEKLAETYYHVAHQHRSAWTHELDFRAYSDVAWWNHP